MRAHPRTTSRTGHLHTNPVMARASNNTLGDQKWLALHVVRISVSLGLHCSQASDDTIPTEHGQEMTRRHERSRGIMRCQRVQWQRLAQANACSNAQKASDHALNRQLTVTRLRVTIGLPEGAEVLSRRCSARRQIRYCFFG